MVCTANVCRSPLLAARLQLEADRRLGAGRVHIASAGTEARFGDPVSGGTAAVARRWGVDLGGHAAQPLSFLDLAVPELILAMTRAHARDLVRRGSTVARRTFLVRELAGILTGRLGATDLAGLPPADPADPPGRIAAVVALARDHRPRRLTRRDDVPDPIGQPQEVYDRLGGELEAVGRALGAALFGPEPAG